MYLSATVSDFFSPIPIKYRTTATTTTVKVKAYGDEDKFSLWSEEYTITNNGSFY